MFLGYEDEAELPLPGNPFEKHLQVYKEDRGFYYHLPRSKFHMLDNYWGHGGVSAIAGSHQITSEDNKLRKQFLLLLHLHQSTSLGKT